GLRLLVYINDITLPILVARMLSELHLGSFTTSNALMALVWYGGFSVWATIVEQNQIDYRDRVKLKIRLTLTAAIHQTALRKRTEADAYSCGIRETQLLATHLVGLTGCVWLPIRVAGGLYVFYRQVGWAVIPGIALTLAYLPLRKHLVRRSTQARSLAAEASSQRVQKLTQLVENIVPLRLLGWDRLLAQGVQSVREAEELPHTTDANVGASLLAFARSVCRSGGPLASLFLYSAYSLTSADGRVTAEGVYLVQAILRELFPLLIDVPHAFDSWWAAQRPYHQIEELLSESPTLSHPTSTTIRSANGSFTWSPSEPSDVDTRMPQRLANLSAFTVKLAFESWIIMEFHPILILSLLVVIAIMRFIVTVSRDPLAGYLAAQAEALPMIDEEYQDSITGAQTIRAFGAHDYAKERLGSRLSAYAQAQRAGDCVETWIDMTMSLLRCVVTSIAFATALVSAANGVAIDPTFMALVYWSITFLLARIQHLHVGVVGRTGAGKTSIVMALLGLLPHDSGSIVIDGIDTTTVPLNTLRERLAVMTRD
ncbi:hypothetical protein GGH91_001090, partial [Coemansia sp. RSA 2671]